MFEGSEQNQVNKFENKNMHVLGKCKNFSLIGTVLLYVGDCNDAMYK